MRLVSAARRLAVTVPFFATAAVLLGFFARPQIVPGPAADGASGSILIVTTPDLNPAFRALQSWNRKHGCATDVYILPRPGSDDPGLGAMLGVLCRQRGVRGLLLGGDRRQLPVTAADTRVRGLVSDRAGLRIESVPVPEAAAMPAHLWMARAPVATLTEAWRFVEVCRENGQTLDVLMGNGGALASMPPDLSRPAPALPAVALPASSD